MVHLIGHSAVFSVCYQHCYFILDGDCNIEKGAPGLPGPSGLSGEVGQKGEASIGFIDFFTNSVIQTCIYSLIQC